MTRILSLALLSAAAVAGHLSTRIPVADPPVNLQTTTPGTPQTGNTNISGRMIAGSVSATDPGASAQAVVGSATSTTGANFGGLFKTSSTSGTGVRGVATASTGGANGGTFQTAGQTGAGVRGFATHSTGINYGVYGKSDSPSGYGVYSAGNMTATGVISGNGSGLSSVNAALLGGLSAASFLQAIPNPLFLSGNASYVIGAENFSSGAAVYGHTLAAGGSGLYGFANNTDSENFGVRGISSSYAGIGVNGICQGGSGSNFGGYFESRSPDGQGLHAVNLSTIGSNNYGVVGETLNSATGWGVYSLGRMGATGTKSFRIDHPADPENKYLLHYSAESPDVLNVYTGNAITDARGYATVRLPNYFDEINRDPRYTLTVVDGSDDFILAKVSREIEANRFVVRTSKPNVKVSWRIDAIRNDRWTQAYGAPVEEDKVGPERGTYQHPELYGQPAEKGVSYRAGRMSSKVGGEPSARGTVKQ